MALILNYVETQLLRQWGFLFPWSAVFLALGCGIYFALPAEPLLWPLGLSLALTACGVLILRCKSPALMPLAIAAFCVCLGLLLPALKARSVVAPVLSERYYGPIEGRISKIDRSASGAIRVSLSSVRLSRISEQETPVLVRLSLLGEEVKLEAGSLVMTTGFLFPPNGPGEPDGFDFRRYAWFQRLGAVGYTRVPVLKLEQSEGYLIARMRYQFARYIRSKIKGEAGAFTAAITTGDRSGLSESLVEALRKTNLAHLLAISGLHMGLLSTFVFLFSRSALILVPVARIRADAKKISTIAALLAAFGYLLLSGGAVATERAFIMSLVALGAVFFERKILSMRAVAIAAICILTLHPESLIGPGFQMSFAATIALVSVFSFLQVRKWLPRSGVLGFVVSTVVSSAVAGLATLPISAAHFNAISQYGLIANLLAVPVMGVLVVPCVVLGLLLAPLGLEAPGLQLAEFGARWILFVATSVAEFENAHITVSSPPQSVLPLMAVGSLVLILWQAYSRYLGLVLIAWALVLWSTHERPDILIAPDGKLVGVMMPDGHRALSSKRSAGFTAERWRENDGNVLPQEDAAMLWGAATQSLPLGLTHIRKEKDLASAHCKTGEIVVTPHRYSGQGGCLVFDATRLKKTGAVAISFRDGTPMISTATQTTGVRPWTQNQ